jgi:hypothetical protein
MDQKIKVSIPLRIETKNEFDSYKETNQNKVLLVDRECST